MYNRLTGQLAPDTLVAALLLLTLFLLGYFLYLERAGELVTTSKVMIKYVNLLRYSDFLLYSVDGLAIAKNGIVRDHVVDCSKVFDAYTYLVSRGFNGKVWCGGLAAGEECEGDWIERPAIWNGRVVNVGVMLCS